MGKKQNRVGAANGEAALVAEATALVKQLKGVLGKLALQQLSADERTHTNGKLRDGETDAIQSVLDAMDAAPAIFSALADKDGGEDDEVVETAPARASLARRALLAPLADALTETARSVSDDVLASGEKVKGVSVPGYAILKANAPSSAQLRSAGSKALTFYGHAGLVAAKTKAKKKKT